MDDALTQTFLEVQPYIQNTCVAFARRHGGEILEYIAEANLIFLQVYEDFDPKKGEFSKRLGYMIWKRLLDQYKKNIRETQHLKEIFLNRSGNRPKSDLGDLIEVLSPDARNVVGIVLEPPPDVLLSLKIFGNESPWHWKLSILEFLKFSGWSNSRIVNVLEELRSIFVDSPK